MRLDAVESSDERSCRKCRPHRWHLSLVLRGEMIRSTHHAREMIIVDWRSHKSRTHEHSEGSTIQALSKKSDDANRLFSSVLERPSLQSKCRNFGSYSKMTRSLRSEITRLRCQAYKLCSQTCRLTVVYKTGKRSTSAWNRKKS